MKKEIIAALITGAVAIIVALITVYGPSQHDKKTEPKAVPPVQVDINNGRKTTISAGKVNYSEKNLIINKEKADN